jgi:hypothetical protein
VTDKHCRSSFLFQTGTAVQAIQLAVWLKGRNLSPELRGKICEAHAGRLTGAGRLGRPIVKTPKIDPSRRGRFNEIWGRLANGEVDLLTIVLDHAIQIWPDTPSPQGFLWARWRSWPQLNGFWGGAVLLARGEIPQRIDAARWLSHELAKRAVAPMPEDTHSGEKELREIYERALELPPEEVKEQLAYRQMICLADLFEGWAIDENVSRENSAYFLGFAESLRNLADEAGPEWRPPESGTLGVLGHLVRWGLGE